MRLPSTSDAVTSPGCHLCCWLTGHKSEVFMTSSLGSIHLPEQLTELRKTCLLTLLPIYYKGYQRIQVKWKWKSLSGVWLFGTHGLYSPWNSPGHNAGVGNLSLLQGIFPTQGSNPGLPHCRQILYPLSHQGSPSFELPEEMVTYFITVSTGPI